MRLIGADVVGMSTVPEVIVAVHAGMRVLGLSIVTDLCLPDALQPAKIEHILAHAAAAEPKLRKIVTGRFEVRAGWPHLNIARELSSWPNVSVRQPACRPPSFRIFARSCSKLRPPAHREKRSAERPRYGERHRASLPVIQRSPHALTCAGQPGGVSQR